MKLLILAVLLSGQTAFAQTNSDGLDAHSAKALQQTQELLRDKEKRKDAVDENDKTRAADTYVDALGADKDKVYDLSADIMATIVKRTKGDVKAMEKLMEEAMKDPAAFGKSLTVEQQREISNIAKPIPPPVNHK
ncbi:MAG: hypothetical protein ABL958_03015 [Bdellovibrionia bacterium]